MRLSTEIMNDLVIIGAGGFGREVLQYARDSFDPAQYRIKGFLDDRRTEVEPRSIGLPVLGTTDGYVIEPNDRFLLAVGEPVVRLQLARRFTARGARFVTLIHPLAYVAGSSSMGTGCIVAPFATVGAFATLGENVVLTFYSSVAHDAVIGSCTALSPYSVVNGGSVVGEAVFIGTHAIINPLKSLGTGSKVAAGSVVYQNVPAHALAAGNPAKSRSLMPMAPATPPSAVNPTPAVEPQAG